MCVLFYSNADYAIKNILLALFISFVSVGYLFGKLISFFQKFLDFRIDELAEFGGDLALGSMVDEPHLLAHAPFSDHAIC